MKPYEDWREIDEDLTFAFMRYQETLEHPMSRMTQEELLARYMNDMVFRNRVKSLTSGVMRIVQKHCTTKQSHS